MSSRNSLPCGAARTRVEKTAITDATTRLGRCCLVVMMVPVLIMTVSCCRIPFLIFLQLQPCTCPDTAAASCSYICTWWEISQLLFRPQAQRAWAGKWGSIRVELDDNEAMAEGDKLKLKSSQGEIFEVDPEAP